MLKGLQQHTLTEFLIPNSEFLITELSHAVQSALSDSVTKIP